MERRSAIDRNLSHDSVLKAAGRVPVAESNSPEKKGPERNRSRDAFWSRGAVKSAQKLLDVAASCMHHQASGCDDVPNLEWLNGRSDREIRLVEFRPTEADRREDEKARIVRRGLQWSFFAGSAAEWDELRKADTDAAGGVLRAENRLRNALALFNESQTAERGAKVADARKLLEEAAKKRRKVLQTLRAESSNPSATHAVLPAAQIACYMVGQVIGELGNPPALKGLLFHRYPRSIGGSGGSENPYARGEGERDYRRFRYPMGDVETIAPIIAREPHLRYAAVIEKMVGGAAGPFVQRSIDLVLENLERTLIEAIVACWHNVADLHALVDAMELAEPGVREVAPMAVAPAPDSRPGLRRATAVAIRHSAKHRDSDIWEIVLQDALGSKVIQYRARDMQRSGWSPPEFLARACGDHRWHVAESELEDALLRAAGIFESD